MTKKEEFILARALASAVCKYKDDVPELHGIINDLVGRVGQELGNQKFVDLYITAIALTLQHGSGDLASIQIGEDVWGA